MRPAQRSLLLAALLASGFAVASRAAECAQEKAIYGQASGSLRLVFSPVGAEGAVIVNRFALVADKVRLSGFVMESEEPVRSVARIEDGCPDGDVTGEDLAACTLFEGYAYAIAEDGTTGALPKEGAPHAPHLLLAGLAPAMAQSAAGGRLKLAAPPSDSFDFRECAP